ncbi:MAG: hypothetical protein EXR52_04640 [Dehalococcoidia bacterium]|nr:hypothetical protein [Dehalococcoidia bacterium]
MRPHREESGGGLVPDWAGRAATAHEAYPGFAAAADRLTPTQREAPRAPGEWSPRAVVAHLVGWDQAFADGLRLVLNGTPELFQPPTDVDGFNAVSVTARQQLSWDELRSTLTVTEGDVQSIARLAERAGLPSDSGFGRWLQGQAEDYTHHAQQLTHYFGAPSLS